MPNYVQLNYGKITQRDDLGRLYNGLGELVPTATYLTATWNGVSAYDVATVPVGYSVTSHTVGDSYLIKFDITNTGAASLDVDVAPSAAIYNSRTGSALLGGEIAGGQVHLLVYTGGNIFELITLGGGSGTSGGGVGPPGPAGTSGTSGISGTSGTSGTSGSSGTSGDTGATGPTGPAGVSVGGAIGSGAFRRVALYNTNPTGTTLADTLDSGATRIFVQTHSSGGRQYTVPDVGAAADFVMTQGTQVISGSKTFTSPTVNTSILAGAAGAFQLLNTLATNISFGGAASVMSIGANTGTLTLNNPTVVGSAATVNLWNTVSTTVNAFQGATSITMGAGPGATITLQVGTINGANTSTFNMNGSNPSIVSSSATSASVFNTNITVGNLFGSAGTIAIGAPSTASTGSQTVTIGNATGTGTYNFGTGITADTVTKTINIGTGGTTGSTNNINIGSSFGGSIAGTTTINTSVITQANNLGATFNMNGLNPTIVTNVANASVTVFDTSVNQAFLFGSAATINIGHLFTGNHIVNMFTNSSGGTFNFATGSTGNSVTKTLNFATVGTAGTSITNINLGIPDGQAGRTRVNELLETTGRGINYHSLMRLTHPTVLLTLSGPSFVNGVTNRLFAEATTATNCYVYNREAIEQTFNSSAEAATYGVTILKYNEYSLGPAGPAGYTKGVVANAVNSKFYWQPSVLDSYAIGRAHFVGAGPYPQNINTTNTGTLIGEYIETWVGAQVGAPYQGNRIKRVKTLSLAYLGGNQNSGNTGTAGEVEEGYDIFIGRSMKTNLNVTQASVLFTNFCGIYIEDKTAASSRDDLRRANIYTNNAYTNPPWSIYAQSDKAMFGGGIRIDSASTFTSSLIHTYLHIQASTATKSHIRLVPGATPTTNLADGDIWYDGTALKIRIGSITRTITVT